MIAPADPHATIEFGRFCIVPLRRELLVDGRVIEFGGRAFDLLIALVQARGSILSKEELIKRAWPDRVVEENNLPVQIAALRKALGEHRDLIRTVAGRGYQFTGEAPSAPEIPPSHVATTPLTNLPEAVSELIGRDGEVDAIARMISDRRLVTLTGSGGIGKTRLGLEVARRVLPEFPDGVWVAELGTLSDPGLVPAAVASALGLTLASGSLSPASVAGALGAKQILLVLDNCEHVIEAAAEMAEAMLHAGSAACVLATSREPLRAEGEYSYRVPPLEVPLEQTADRDELLKAGAVKLFIARMRASEAKFSPDTRIVAMAAICRRLDGIPLAIELAAARAAALGVEGLAARLDDRFRLLTGGHRTALARHQTLRATLDWSFELLPAVERVVLRRLAVFVGSFTLDSASAVVSDTQIARVDVVDYVANLVAKSLVTANVGSATAQYRLLNTTHAYALEKLRESGEYDEFARRHAMHHCDVFERAVAELETVTSGEWIAVYGRQIDNVRAALDWTFSSAGEVQTGIALTVAAVPLWMHLSLIDECRARTERAFRGLSEHATGNGQREMHLYAALGASLLQTKGPAPETEEAWSKALSIAEAIGDVDYLLRALWGLCAYRVNAGELRAALPLARAFETLARARSDPVDALVGERMIGMTLHYLGEQGDARRHTQRMLDHYVAPAHRSHIIRFQFDQQVAARGFLGLILWLQGFPEQARLAVRRSVDEARATNHALSLCYALEIASRTALLADGLDDAEQYCSMLLDYAAKGALSIWHARGRCANGVLMIRRGDVAAGVAQLDTALKELRGARFAGNHTAYLGALAEALGDSGRVDEGLLAIGEALAESDRTEERWYFAELLRIKGELLLMHGGADAVSAAEDLFRQAIDSSTRQDALSWKLRGATSLARLRSLQGRTGEARELLAPVLGRFTEGFATTDVKSAKTLLDSLQ